MLRGQWLAQTLHDLGETPLSRQRAEWVTAPLVVELHGRCRRAGDEVGKAVWPLAGAICQTLHWTEEGVGQTDVRHMNALRDAWFGALPPGVRAALSADGGDPFGPGDSVLIRGDGEVAARLPSALIRCVLGSVDGGMPEASDMSLACETLPGWRWRGVRVVTRDPDSAMGYGLGCLVGFVANRSWTFRHAGSWRVSLARWLLVVAVAYGANLSLVVALHESLRVDARLAQVAGVVVYTVVAFLGARLVAFRASARPTERTRDSHG